MMLLPTPVNNAALRGFWLFVSIVTGLCTALVSALAFDGPTVGELLAMGLSLAAVMAAPGLMRPSIVWYPYRAWNWMARRFGRSAIQYVTAVGQFTVMLALSKASRPRVFERRPSHSTWRKKGTQESGTYLSQSHIAPPDSFDGWREAFALWRRSSGHHLAGALVPFVMLIRALDTEEVRRQDSPDNIYTLY